MKMPLSTSGRFIVDADGRRVRLAGVNWYGFHEDDGVAPGLDRTDRRTLARRIAMLGFNSVRLPFSLWMTEQAAPVPDQYLAANPDLSGATPIEVYDACVEALTEARPSSSSTATRSTRAGAARVTTNRASGSMAAGRPRRSSPPGRAWRPGTSPTRWSPGWTS